jgi:hypothetical protein
MKKREDITHSVLKRMVARGILKEMSNGFTKR